MRAAVLDYDMACFHPMPAIRVDGRVVFVRRGDTFTMKLPCGQCTGCRLERSRHWAIRIMNEASMHEECCFLTLTYDDAHLPMYGSLDYRDFQLFMKRLRKRFPSKKLRFFMCGEYGENLYRPHYHCIIFGLSFVDRVLHSRTKCSFIYVDSILSSLWPFGYSSIGDVTFESAAYVARYCMKKVTGQAAEEHYKRVVVETGEIVSIQPEFCHMSLKPGIGAPWFDRFTNDVYPHDRIVSRGTVSRPPRYYFKRFKNVNLSLYNELHQKHLDNLLNNKHNTFRRLHDRGLVTQARVNQYSRNSF